MSEKIFINGLVYRPPHPKAPDFVKGTLSINVAEFSQFLSQHDNKAVNGWINGDIKVSKGGKYYVELNTYQRSERKVDTSMTANKETDELNYPEAEVKPDDIPF